MSKIKVGDYYVYDRGYTHEGVYTHKSVYKVTAIMPFHIQLMGVSKDNAGNIYPLYPIEDFYGGKTASSCWRLFQELDIYDITYKPTITPKQKQSLIELIREI